MFRFTFMADPPMALHQTFLVGLSLVGTRSGLCTRSFARLSRSPRLSWTLRLPAQSMALLRSPAPSARASVALVGLALGSMASRAVPRGALSRWLSFAGSRWDWLLGSRPPTRSLAGSRSLPRSLRWTLRSLQRSPLLPGPLTSISRSAGRSAPDGPSRRPRNVP